MTQAQAIVVLPVGIFPLITPWEKIQGIYEDERAGTITFQGTDAQYLASITIVLSGPASENDPPGMRGHTIEPKGFKVRLFQVGQSPWIEISSEP